MTSTPSLQERKAYACNAFAMQSLLCARRHIELYLKTDPHKEFEMCEALTMSILSFYFRPFKGKEPLKLDKSIVPAQFTGLHGMLETMRDKVFAHRDTNLPSASWGNANDIGFIIDKNHVMPSVYMGLMEPGQAVNLRLLIIELEKLISLSLAEFYRAYVPRDIEDGKYVVRLNEDAALWFEKTQGA